MSLLTEGATSGVARSVGWLADNVNTIKQTLGNKLQAASGWAKEKLAAAGSLAREGWDRVKGWAEERSIQHAIERWNDPNLSMAERVKVEQFLRKKGAQGLWQGGVANEIPDDVLKAMRISDELQMTPGQKGYLQESGTLGPEFDPTNADQAVLLGYRYNLEKYSGAVPGVHCLQTDNMAAKLFGPWAGKGLAEINLRGHGGWQVELLDAMQNTKTINFLIDDMDLFNHSADFRKNSGHPSSNTTHWEMDRIIERGYTDKLHLYQNGEELTGLKRSRWLDTWKEIRGLD